MNENQTACRVKHHLNQGIQLDSRILSRLEAAREHALAHQRTVASTPALVWVTNVAGRWSWEGQSLFPRLFFPTIALIIGLMAISTWRQTQLAEEIEEIDAAMLTGDLPIDAYMDTGFDAWLKRSSQ